MVQERAQPVHTSPSLMSEAPPAVPPSDSLPLPLPSSDIAHEVTRAGALGSALRGVPTERPAAHLGSRSQTRARIFKTDVGSYIPT